jgi:S1-C subfamily serine protease
MRRSRPFALVLMLAAALGCRRDVPHLDEVQKMAYAVKPAVVRVSAYATAEFHYPASAIESVQTALSNDGYDLVAQRAGADGAVSTGAGGSGSGFIIHPDGLILTSGHVVAATRERAALDKDLMRNGAIAALVKHFPIEELRKVHRSEGLGPYIATLAEAGSLAKFESVSEVELSNGEKLPFKIERFSPELGQRGSDLALLRVTRKDLPVLPLGDSDQVRVGESIWSVGYPAVASSTDDVIGGWLSRDSDLEATFNPGSITAIKRNIADAQVFQSNVAIYRGNSGGPAVNVGGEVVGISTWGHTDAESVKFLVPINVAKLFLSGANVSFNVESDFTRHYRAALDAAGEGRWTSASAELNRASALFRNAPDLIRFRRDVDRALQSMPLWQKQPLMLGGAGVAVVAVAFIVAFTRARRGALPKDLQTAVTHETMVSPSSFPSGSPSMLGKFTILNGEHAGQRMGLGGSGIRIGRESSICEIVLENPKVSRLHAEVVSIDGKVLLIDRNSSNGTYVNDQKIDKRYLKDGDIIYFGGRNAIAVAFHA